MSKNVMLDIDAILRKEFSVEFKGYSALEVDQYLDIIVKDYDAYNNQIIELNEQISQLDEERYSLKEKIAELENKLKVMEESAVTQTTTPVVNNLSQVDILRRIARLEQEVFNRK